MYEAIIQIREANSFINYLVYKLYPSFCNQLMCKSCRVSIVVMPLVLKSLNKLQPYILYLTVSQNIPTMLLVVVYFSVLVPAASMNYIPAAYSQNQLSSFQVEAKALDDIPVRKVKVGDIDIAYRQLGKSTNSKPIVLINGQSTTMDMWSPSLIRELSSNRTVVIFDNRGVGESTVGIREFSISQFANDTVGLLDALKIEKADVLGSSMGSFIAQELALKNPNRVNSLILSGSSCGGKAAIPPSPKVLQALNATIANTASSTTREEIDRITSTLFPSDWFKSNPNYHNYIPFPKEPVSPQIIKRQQEAIINWFSVGTCNALSNITQHTLIIVGTDDMWTPAANSLMIAQKIPGAWLVQIRDAGHGLIYQFPDKFSKVVLTFLNTLG
jgi:pimeloyl-ACP methyl ester carboxylesterase